MRGILIAVMLCLSGCAAPAPQAPDWSRIMADAALLDPAQPVPPLSPITGPEAHLVTWRRAGTVIPGAASYPRPLWATVDGELLAFCRNLVAREHPDSAHLRRRIERLLGLREGDGEQRVIVEFTVAAKDVFRPCPDPAIDTTSCPLHFDDQQLSRLIDENPESSKIMLMQMLGSYSNQSGYPFTRRGYTYDWDSSAAPLHVGLSEYVTRIGAPLQILRVSSLDDYCAAH